MGYDKVCGISVCTMLFGCTLINGYIKFNKGMIMNFWIARDKEGELFLYPNKPKRGDYDVIEVIIEKTIKE